MPRHLAARFTAGELAVLHLVAVAVRSSGVCAMTVPELAARAGVGQSTVRNAVRTAAGLGLLRVQERRQHGRPNLANLIRIVSPEWLAWLARGGFKNAQATKGTDKKRGSEVSQIPESYRNSRRKKPDRGGGRPDWSVSNR